MELNYLEGTLGAYLDRLASREPVPRGGSAAALSASLAAALLSMTANFTVGKKRFASVGDEVRTLLKRTEELRREAARLVEEDSRVYLAYRQAVALEKDDLERPAVLREALASGNELLFKIAEYSLEILKISGRLLEIGNPYLRSDVGCAAVLARAAVEAAEMNVLINLSGFSGVEKETAGQRLKEIKSKADTMENRVLEETRCKLIG